MLVVLEVTPPRIRKLYRDLTEKTPLGVKDHHLVSLTLCSTSKVVDLRGQRCMVGFEPGIMDERKQLFNSTKWNIQSDKKIWPKIFWSTVVLPLIQPKESICQLMLLQGNITINLFSLHLTNQRRQTVESCGEHGVYSTSHVKKASR